MKQIPTIKEIFERFSDKIKSELDIPSNEDLKENLSALGMVISAELKLLYLYLQDIQRNVYPQTADYSEYGGQLNRLGAIYLNRPPHPATKGTYIISADVLPNSSGTIPLGTTFKTEDGNDSVYVVESEINWIVGETTLSFPVTSFGVGSSNRLLIGDLLYLTSPLSGIDSPFIVSSETQSPVNEESEEDYRRAIINAIQLEPQGGARADYVLWAQDSAGVRKVYPYIRNGDITILDIFVEAYKDDSVDGRGTPSAQLINQTEQVLITDPDTSAYLYERGRKPIQTNLSLKPVVLVPVDIVISGLFKETSQEWASISDFLTNYLYEIRPFLAGAQLIRDKNDILNSARVSNEVVKAISSDNYFTELKVFVNFQEISNYIFDNGNIPYLNSVSYV